ncbi:hypothetical protein PIB30_064467 [Stylosanthes scabra]|uniref:Uncharacterized protein n=1 Tax=Stylosanthes scabra TaxID=79078 RepID=A0ABU6WK05_9FABA|nr:hypothetical protein [Stylosanthes scabra]
MGQGNLAEFEEWKCIKYEGGLREELLTSVGPMEIRNFAELINKSQLAEDCTKKLTAARASRRDQPPRPKFQKTMGSFSVVFHLREIVFLGMLPTVATSRILVEDCSKFGQEGLATGVGSIMGISHVNSKLEYVTLVAD